jgi:hypothetical protein
MPMLVIDNARRHWLIRAGQLIGSLVWLPPLLLLPQCAPSASRSPLQGLRSAPESLQVNQQPLAPETPLPEEATLTTADHNAMIVVGDDALLIRPHSRLRVLSKRATRQESLQRIQHIQLISGGVLAALGQQGPRTFKTAQAVVSIRGTALYLETRAQSTYLCTCYGVVQLNHALDPSVNERLATQHHEAPRIIYDLGLSDHASELCVPAPMLNHTDAELVQLEGLVGREPPFLNDTSLTGRAHY